MGGEKERGSGGAVDGGEAGEKKEAWAKRVDAGVKKATPDSMTVAAIVDSDDVHVESVPQSACFFHNPSNDCFLHSPSACFLHSLQRNRW